jgi:hypothetical protein
MSQILPFGISRRGEEEASSIAIAELKTYTNGGSAK